MSGDPHGSGQQSSQSAHRLVPVSAAIAVRSSFDCLRIQRGFPRMIRLPGKRPATQALLRAQKPRPASRQGILAPILKNPMQEPNSSPRPSANRPSTRTFDCLDHNQQIELFRIIETAESRLKELEGNPGASFGEINHLKRTVEKARHAIINSCNGLVLSIVRKYENLGLEHADLVQEGQIGLIQAVEKFDCRRGCKLSTYADIWIRQSIRRALSNQSRTIRIPEYKLDQVRKVRQVRERLARESGHEPEVWEIADEIGLSEQQVAELLELSGQTISLDAPGSDPDSPALLERISDGSAVDPSQEADNCSRKELLGKWLARLSRRERGIIDLRFGLADGCRRTLEEIGNLFGVTRERIRQIVQNALEKLRQCETARKVRSLALMHKASPAGKRLGKKYTPSKKDSTLPSGPEQKGGSAQDVTSLKMRSVKNLNHHIWNNNGTWYCNFVVLGADGLKERVRDSLKTKNVEEARALRDEKMRSFGAALLDMVP